MKSKAALLTLTVLIPTLFGGCLTSSGRGAESAGVGPQFTHEKITAVEFPELTLTAGNETRRVKLLALEDRQLIFLPFPYWQVEPEVIPLEEVHTLKVEKKSYPGLSWGLGSAASGFIITGLIAGNQALYQEEYASAMLLAAGCGLVVGGVGFFLGLDMKDSLQPEYLLVFMNPEQKLKTLRKIMGLRDTKRRRRR